MDSSLFISANGASSQMHQLEIVTNNLANVNTTAFRSDSTFMQQYPISKQGNQSRVYSRLQGSYTDFKQGAVINTQRDLDIALDGDGFIAVQSAKLGKEGYTRAGSLKLTQDGVLVNQNGDMVLGNAGVINIPQAEHIHIANDGTVSAQFPGSADFAPIDRIKLTNPSVAELQKGTDALFYLDGGGTANQDPNVKIVTGAVEGSNVNAIDAMTQLIDLTRNYEAHTNFIKTFADNAVKANQLLELSR